MGTKVWACGFNAGGNLGANSAVAISSPVVVNTTGWYQMPYGTNTVVAIDNNRNLWT
jgi:hypothetical protein